MDVNVIVFGQLKEYMQNNKAYQNVADTNALVNLLQQEHAELTTVKYRIAVNNKIITENTILTHNSTVALLPAFSGG